MCTTVGVGACPPMNAAARGVQKRVSYSLELELQVVSHPLWLLGTID